ncbi:osteocalcin 2-like [Dermacentor silvarum]|uniref:osteocalcin 2-like n=1 Tax=Dermacentor silvarum TaxID=543639 RepID=UPI00210084B7|nr:osteocalcin 2-like [Dermacentor silvarum]
MGGFISTPLVQLGFMSAENDRPDSPPRPVTMSRVVRMSSETRGNWKRTRIQVVLRSTSSSSSLDSTTSSESSQSSESCPSDVASESGSSNSSRSTLGNSSFVSSSSESSFGRNMISSASSGSSSSSSLSSDEWATRSPARKIPRCRWPFTSRRRTNSRHVGTEDPADGNEAGASNGADAAGTSDDLVSKLREMEEALTCAICMNRRRNIAFMCGHGTCSKCAAQIDICHICRRPIEKKIRLH